MLSLGRTLAVYCSTFSILGCDTPYLFADTSCLEPEEAEVEQISAHEIRYDGVINHAQISLFESGTVVYLDSVGETWTP